MEQWCRLIIGPQLGTMIAEAAIATSRRASATEEQSESKVPMFGDSFPVYDKSQIAIR